MSLSAPYRFVPLSKLLLLPDWADQVSHDTPFEDGVCGELDVTLTSQTPLCVGGKQRAASKDLAGQVNFYRTPDDKPAIPGSSLKGMLRNVMEIATFAHFRQVEERRLGVRDISDAKNFYCRTITRIPAKAGWLSFVGGQWQIQPCDFSRLHQQDLIDTLKLKKETWTKSNAAEQRYALFDHKCPSIRFNTTPMKNGGKFRAIPASDGAYSGSIVATGQPGSAFDASKSSKKYEFVFHDSDQPVLIVDSAVVKGFMQIHESSNEWAYWQTQTSKGRYERGIPVFYHSEASGAGVKSLGLAMMYKLPYENSLHDAIRHTLPEHLSDTNPDLADLIFGFLGEEKQPGLRGRVNIGIATANQDIEFENLGPVILSSPQPTFYPAYIRQDGEGNQVRQLMEKQSELAGWKRYPVKALDIQRPTGKAAENKKTQVSLQAVPENTEFTFKVRLHNLKRVELGALLWVLDFGEDSGCSHGLGMGKPFGMGQVKLKLSGSRLRANNGDSLCQRDDQTYLAACRYEFNHLMDQLMLRAEVDCEWQKSEVIKSLKEMAREVSNPSSLKEYRYFEEPKQFVDWRHSKNLEEVVETFHSSSGAASSKPDFDAAASQPHTASLEQALSVIEQIKQKEQAAAARAEAKANATEEGEMLLDVENVIEDCLQGEPTKSQKENLGKALNKAHSAKDQFDEEQKSALLNLAYKADQVEYKKVQQATKKIRRDIQLSEG